MVRWRLLVTSMIFQWMKTWLSWDEKRVEVEKIEIVLSTSFHVNRKKRNWMVTDFFLF